MFENLRGNRHWYLTKLKLYFKIINGLKIDKKKKFTKVKNIGKFKDKVIHKFPRESKSLYMAGYTLFIISTNISGIINTIL